MYIAVTKLVRKKSIGDAWKITQTLIKSILLNDYIIVTKFKYKFIEALINLTPKFFDNTLRFEFTFLTFSQKLSDLKKIPNQSPQTPNSNLLGCLLHTCLKLTYSVSKDKIHNKEFTSFLFLLHDEEERQDIFCKDVVEIFYLHLIHYKWTIINKSMMKENSIFNESTLAHSKKIEQIICRVKYTLPTHLNTFKDILLRVGLTRRSLTDHKLMGIIGESLSDSDKEER